MGSNPNDPRKPATSRFQILVCDGPSCGVMHESDELVERLRAAVGDDPDLQARVGVVNFTCFGRCEDGPNMFVRSCGPDDDPCEESEPETEVFEQQRGFYPTMDEDKVLRVLREHCGKGEIVDDLVDDY